MDLHHSEMSSQVVKVSSVSMGSHLYTLQHLQEQQQYHDLISFPETRG